MLSTPPIRIPLCLHVIHGRVLRGSVFYGRGFLLLGEPDCLFCPLCCHEHTVIIIIIIIIIIISIRSCFFKCFCDGLRFQTSVSRCCIRSNCLAGGSPVKLEAMGREPSTSNPRSSERSALLELRERKPSRLQVMSEGPSSYGMNLTPQPSAAHPFRKPHSIQAFIEVSRMGMMWSFCRQLYPTTSTCGSGCFVGPVLLWIC